MHAPAVKPALELARKQLGRIRPWGIAVGGIALLTLLGALIVYVPPVVLGVNQLSKVASLDAADQVKAVSDLRTAFLQGLAGIGLAATVYFSARTLQLNRRGQVTDRFTKAIEQLGSDALDVRLGGIYALEQIARDSRELHGAIVEILAAFLREHARSSDSGRKSPPPARADFQAVATVLGRRKVECDVPGQHLDLSGVTLASCNFVRAHLEGADFTNAHLEGADFTDADLHGDAHLHGTDFTEAHLEGAKFGDADLHGDADPDGAFLGAIFTAAHLERAYFASAHLERAYFRGADLQQANFVNAHVEGAYFASAHLEGANFTGADGLTLAQLQEGHGFNEAICNYYWTPGQKQVQTRQPQEAADVPRSSSDQ